jgi:iron complex transport system substrate-binding protein
VSGAQASTCSADTVITGDANFFRSYAANSVWAAVPAAAAKRVYLAPRLPFGFIDQPPSINRTIGLRWMAGVLYPDKFPDDIRGTVKEFFRLFYQTEPDDAALDRVLAGEQPGGSRR